LSYRPFSKLSSHDIFVLVSSSSCIPRTITKWSVNFDHIDPKFWIAEPCPLLWPLWQTSAYPTLPFNPLCAIIQVHSRPQNCLDFTIKCTCRQNDQHHLAWLNITWKFCLLFRLNILVTFHYFFFLFALI